MLWINMLQVISKTAALYSSIVTWPQGNDEPSQTGFFFFFDKLGLLIYYLHLQDKDFAVSWLKQMALILHHHLNFIQVNNYQISNVKNHLLDNQSPRHDGKTHPVISLCLARLSQGIALCAVLLCIEIQLLQAHDCNFGSEESGV